jgi:hypothetical protein
MVPGIYGKFCGACLNLYQPICILRAKKFVNYVENLFLSSPPNFPLEKRIVRGHIAYLVVKKVVGILVEVLSLLLKFY